MNQNTLQTQTGGVDQSVSDGEILNKDILELMGASGLPKKKRQKLYAKMLDTIQNRVIARVADQLSEPDLKEWHELAETGDNQQIDRFLKGRGIDVAQLQLQEALMYKAEMVKLAKPIDQANP